MLQKEEPHECSVLVRFKASLDSSTVNVFDRFSQLHRETTAALCNGGLCVLALHSLTYFVAPDTSLPGQKHVVPGVVFRGFHGEMQLEIMSEFAESLFSAATECALASKDCDKFAKSFMHGGCNVARATRYELSWGQIDVGDYEVS